MNSEKVRLEFLHDGQVARVVLAAPKANIVDRVMMFDLMAAFHTLRTHEELKAVVLTADGPHFSFGASVEEHLPEQIGETLSRLGNLLREIAAAPAPTIAAVRGQCLGGGFELVLACDLVIAEENAQLGLPEIKLAVFPPAGAALLPVRVGASRAAQVVLTGATWSGASAAACGLVHQVAPAGELDRKVEELLQSDFLPRAVIALGYAAQAARRPITHALQHDLPALERLYLEQLMRHPDAEEGIRAFLEKRQPKWQDKSAKASA